MMANSQVDSHDVLSMMATWPAVTSYIILYFFLLA